MSFSVDTFLQSFGLPSDSKSSLPLNLYFDLWGDPFGGDQAFANKKIKTVHGVLATTAYTSVESYVANADPGLRRDPSVMSFRAQTLMKATLIPEGMIHQGGSVYVVMNHKYYDDADYCLMYMFRSRQDARDFSAEFRRKEPKAKLSAIGRYSIHSI